MINVQISTILCLGKNLGIGTAFSLVSYKFAILSDVCAILCDLSRQYGCLALFVSDLRFLNDIWAILSDYVGKIMIFYGICVVLAIFVRCLCDYIG